MFWLIIDVLFYLIISSGSDTSGAGMVLLFFIPLSGVVILIVWLIYFMIRSFFGIV